MSSSFPNLTYVKQFIVVAEEKSISKAAEKLRVSQPALSKNLRKLEEFVGAKLFERHARGSSLNESGQAFLRRARIIELEYQHAIQEIKNMLHNQEGTIRIGAGPVWSSTVIPSSLSKFHRRYPNHNVIVETGSTNHISEKLRLGELDILAGPTLSQYRFPGFKIHNCATSSMGVLCSEDHPLAQIKGILDPREITKYPFVSYALTPDAVESLASFLQKFGAQPPRYLVETTSLFSSIELARTGSYLLYEAEIIADHRIGRGLVKLEFSEPIKPYGIGFIYRNRLDKKPPYRAILDAMIEVFDDVIGEN